MVSRVISLWPASDCSEWERRDRLEQRRDRGQELSFLSEWAKTTLCLVVESMVSCFMIDKFRPCVVRSKTMKNNCLATRSPYKENEFLTIQRLYWMSQNMIVLSWFTYTNSIMKTCFSGNRFWIIILQLSPGWLFSLTHKPLVHQNIEALTLARQPDFFLQTLSWSDASNSPIISTVFKIL